MSTMANLIRNEVNRGLDSNKLTDLIYGTVKLLQPLTVEIDSRFEITNDFILFSPDTKTMKLKKDDVLTMIRFRKGQLYYVLEINGTIINTMGGSPNLDGGKADSNFGGHESIYGGDVNGS